MWCCGPRGRQHTNCPLGARTNCPDSHVGAGILFFQKLFFNVLCYCYCYCVIKKPLINLVLSLSHYESRTDFKEVQP